MPEAPNPNSPGSNHLKPLKSTLNLPQTAFPMKANLPINEPLRLHSWEDSDLYAQIRAARAGAPRYILHDGPPYANGAIHLGHALNKTLKDFVVKTKTMAGFDAPYVPGWDCHGLPIEIKVDEQLGRKKLQMEPLAVRRACREYAQKYLDLQREQFIRLGCFGRWAAPYSTMDAVYEARIAETFYHFFERGFVYKGLKPVSWCIHDRTALAEAEVEYENHTSPSIYVRYKLTSGPADIAPELAGKPVYAVIWTTTPWTLPASLAIAFNPDMQYNAVEVPGAVYLVAAERLGDFIEMLQKELNLESVTLFRRGLNDLQIKGTALDRATFAHPFLDRAVLGTNATYVTADQGTGAVHTAPAHGVDDFATGKRYDLPEVQYVDDSGRQMHTERFGGGQPQPYDGLTVFKSNPVIVELLKEKGALLAISNLDHSYPHCWRCHNPVITRATEQWFIAMDTPMPGATTEQGAPSMAQSHRDMGGLSRESATAFSSEAPPPTTLRQRALDEIKTVTWDPAWGQERITNMVATRPDWCISRQRIWGVPIAVFLCAKCGEPLRNPEINKRIVSLFATESADAWYIRTPEEMLPLGTACSCGHTEFRKEMDILDVWFESGSSSHAVLDFDADVQQKPGDPDQRADLYAEGGDQHRGWFMSSLLCSIGMHNRAPFKEVATYGWTLDEQGRALSKSLGNFIDPVAIMDQLGGDIVRLWVASVDFREDVVASLPLLRRLAEEIYRKLRNTFRFLLGALSETDPTTGEVHDFDPATDAVAFDAMQPIDQYILARTAELTAKIRAAYEAFEFHRVYHLLNEFLNSELSAFYLDVLKDRLYTYPIKFKPGNAPAASGKSEQEKLYLARRSAQTAIYKITDALARLTAPILSFTADEVWQSLPGATKHAASVHLTLFPESTELAPSLALPTGWVRLMDTRDIVFKKLEIARAEKIIGKGLEASIRIDISNLAAPLNAYLLDNHDSLPEVFNVSSVELPKSGLTDQTQGIQIDVIPAPGTKCERCWRHVPDVGQEEKYPTVCLRCAEALDAIDFPPYPASTA
jgi:isoleucyl-tRNA synthetase